ncbi:MAG: radical SAM protein [Deltaproteobacteria bacterium]|nr:MAG: radical SAM protein [Deltaproteobacteria bacterium]
MKILFVYPRFSRHAESNPELLRYVPMKEYLGSPSLGIPSVAAVTPPEHELEYRDDRLEDALVQTDADLVALTFFTAAAARGLELARGFKAMGKTVVAGGIFPSLMPDEVQPHVDAVIVGEGEPVWPQLLADFAVGALKPRYGPVIADLDTLPPPRMDLVFGAERPGFQPDDYPLQVSRGCALTCQACALPRSMGRRTRPFPMAHVLAQLQTLEEAGKRASLTEDTGWFSGTAGFRRMFALFEHLAERGRATRVSYVGISMPMILATPGRRLAQARAAGVDMFYLVGGFDPITMKAFTGRDRRAWNRGIAAVRKAWDHGIEPYTSFLLGNDDDDEGTVDRMLEFAEQAGIRKAEFAIFTPYPGTPAWFRLLEEGRILTRDWSRYNDANVVFRPRRMTPDQLHEGYLRLWREFYAARPEVADLDEAARTIQF